ncbi:MAG: beta-lactamase, partial [Acidimicrobiaceae bacterium]
EDDVHGRIVGHSGGLPGYGSNMRWIAGRRIGVVALANVKYAPMGELTLRMLDVLGDHDALPPVAERAGRQSLADLERFAKLLVDLLAGWTDEAADALFADNVGLDEPYASRAAAAAELVERMGAIAIDRVVASTSTSASVTVGNGAGATETVSFDLTPLLPRRIQSYLIGEEAD